MIFGKIIVWQDIKEIIRLNKEADLGNPEPEKLVAAYHRLLKKLAILIIFLLGLLILVKNVEIGN